MEEFFKIEVRHCICPVTQAANDEVGHPLLRADLSDCAAFHLHGIRLKLLPQLRALGWGSHKDIASYDDTALDPRRARTLRGRQFLPGDGLGGGLSDGQQPVGPGKK